MSKIMRLALASALALALALPAISDAQAQRRPIGGGTVGNPYPVGGATKGGVRGKQVVERRANNVPTRSATQGGPRSANRGIQNKGVKGCETCVDGGASARGRATVRVPRQF